jgi:hypothetical protein
MANFNSSEQSQIVIVNGVKMTMREYKKQSRKAQKAKKQAKEISAIRLLPQEINYLMKQVKVIKSLGAYYDNGYKQWGVKCRDFVIKHQDIEKHFLNFYMRSKELFALSNEIEKISKANDKAVFQYVQKFTWKLQDLQLIMENLCKGVSKSGVMEHFKDYEFINGQNRRLGLKVLIKRSSKAIDELYQIISDHSGQTIEKIRQDADRDYWMTANEALEYGMIDKVYSKK